MDSYPSNYYRIVSVSYPIQIQCNVTKYLTKRRQIYIINLKYKTFIRSRSEKSLLLFF